MKNKRLVWGLAVLLIVGVSTLMWKTHERGSHTAHTGAVRKTMYYCPMHPNYVSERPGKCPICNMDLVLKEETVSEGANEGQAAPREFTVAELLKLKPHEICLLHKCKKGPCLIAMNEESARLGKCPHCGEDLGVIIKDAVPAGYSAVKLTADKQRMIGVKTDTVKKMPMTKTIRTVGKIAYDPELYQAEEEYLQSAQALRKAQSGTNDEIKAQAAQLADASKIKLKLLGLSDELISEIEKSGKADRSLLYSEGGGHVWLYAPVYEYEMHLIKSGQTIEAQVPAIEGKVFTGVIRSIDSVLDPVTRAVRVRAVLDNPDGALKPEMYANASVKIDLGETLTVPEEAVFETGDQSLVFVTKDGSVFEPREVTLGVKSDKLYQVKSGLGEGETVVTSGNFLIDSESKLKSALEGMSDSGSKEDRGSSAVVANSSDGQAGSAPAPMGAHQHGG